MKEKRLNNLELIKFKRLCKKHFKRCSAKALKKLSQNKKNKLYNLK